MVDGAGAVSPRERLGRAEDGALVRIAGPAGHLAGLAQWWPPLGLSPIDASAAPSGPDVELFIELDGPLERPDVFVDGTEAVGGWDRVESDLGLFAADHLVGRIAVHAGLVAWNGAGLVLPGPSHAGKSTLVLALAAAGATVLSDEYALVDPGTGLVSGWPRPVRQRRPSGVLARPLVPETAGAPVPVAVVGTVRFDPSAGLILRSVSAADAAVDLLANTVAAQRHPELALRAAAAVVRGALTVGGTRGEATDAAEALLEIMAAHTPGLR